MVPEKTDKKVNILLKKIKSDHEPVYVPVHPERYAQINQCIPAVERKVKNDNGEIVYGWQILKTRLICEAVFHAVWKSPLGELIDITPKQCIVDNILFVPDDKIHYDGCQIDNIRLNNTSNILVDDLIYINEALFMIMNKGERKRSYKVSLKGQEAQAYKYCLTFIAYLEQYIYNGGTLKTYCFCGSDKRYINCHRVELNHVISTLDK